MLNITKEEISKQIKKTISLVLMSAVCTVSVASVGTFSRKVDINVDSGTISTITINTDTNKILDQVGVTISEGDVVSRYEGVDGTLKLDVKRAFDVIVTKGEKTVTLKKAIGKVSNAISESGIQMEESDDVNFDLDSDLEANMEIVIRQRIKIKINSDGELKEFLVPLGSVNDALEYLGFPISSEDIVNVDVFSNVYEGMEITVNRIVQRETVKTEDIPFKSIVKKTNLLEVGTRTVTAQGKKGQKEITLKETLMDGNVIKSEEIKSRIISEPTDELILEGTKKSTKAVSSSVALNESSQGANVLVGSATAYTSSGAARTSTGAVPTPGVTIAVNPKIIPYGKRITVKSVDGSFECQGIAQDTGGALKKGSALVDIYMSSESKCIEFGRKRVKVYVN